MRHPFANILLATEHTEFDSGSERVALEMAKACGLPLSVVVPISSNPEFEAAAQPLVERVEQETASRMAELEKIAKDAGVQLAIRPRRGVAAEEIIGEALDRKSDLIIIRRRGRRGFLEKLLIGEMVSQVVSNSPCSVLMVPRACRMWTRGILAAVDGSSLSERVASVSAEIASECALPLYLLCVAASEDKMKDAERVLSNAKKVAEASGVVAKTLVRVGQPCDQILTAPFDADLTVVGMSDVNAGGTARKVVEMSEKPVLVVR
jgi:nucleotide-binding universal stress UspA family protein